MVLRGTVPVRPAFGVADDEHVRGGGGARGGDRAAVAVGQALTYDVIEREPDDL